MAFNPCVKAVLGTLSLPVLTTLRAVINAQVGVLTALQATLQARLAVLNVQVIPVRIARDAALNVLAEAQSVANLLPLDVIEGCADLGSLQASMSAGVEQATAGVRDLADDATRLLSLNVELTAQITELGTLISQLNDFDTTLQECITAAL